MYHYFHNIALNHGNKETTEKLEDLYKKMLLIQEVIFSTVDGMASESSYVTITPLIALGVVLEKIPLEIDYFSSLNAIDLNPYYQVNKPETLTDLNKLINELTQTPIHTVYLTQEKRNAFITKIDNARKTIQKWDEEHLNLFHDDLKHLQTLTTPLAKLENNPLVLSMQAVNLLMSEQRNVPQEKRKEYDTLLAALLNCFSQHTDATTISNNLQITIAIHTGETSYTESESEKNKYSLFKPRSKYHPKSKKEEVFFNTVTAITAVITIIGLIALIIRYATKKDSFKTFWFSRKTRTERVIEAAKKKLEKS